MRREEDRGPSIIGAQGEAEKPANERRGGDQKTMLSQNNKRVSRHLSQMLLQASDSSPSGLSPAFPALFFSLSLIPSTHFVG